MKREEALLASSSSCRRESTPENLQAKNIGCMSGIFQLVCKYQNRRRFLTFGKKQEKKVVSCSIQEENKKELANTMKDLRRLTCDVPRSPTLPAEIRRSNSVHVNSPSPAIVARLMGLDAFPESAAEKRRKLLGALEKCDEDLKALKQIIEIIKTSTGVDVGVGDHKSGILYGRDREGEFFEQEKTCLEVTNCKTTSAFSGYSKRYTNGRVLQQQKQQQKKKPGEEEDIANICIFDRITTELAQAKIENIASPLSTNKAMITCVNEVCSDIAWGERREIGRIGLALQDYIYRDLIEEIVREMGCCGLYSLPFEACKRRICF